MADEDDEETMFQEMDAQQYGFASVVGFPFVVGRESPRVAAPHLQAVIDLTLGAPSQSRTVPSQTP